MLRDKVILALIITLVAGLIGVSLHGLAFGSAFGLTFGIVFLRAYYHPFHFLFILPLLRGRWYPFHPVAWDGMCALPFPGLDRLLVAYRTLFSKEGEAEIERLISEYASQQTSGLKARVATIAREAASTTDLTALPQVLARLPEGADRFLVQAQRVGELVLEISREQDRLNAVVRPHLRALRAELLHTKIEAFHSKVSGFVEPLASEFRAAAEQWRAIAEQQLSEVRAKISREPTPQVFRAGDPVDRNQEAFVYRDAVVGELEQQIELSAGCPGLILYGRRRMGKSTVLRDLALFPRPGVGVALISMENPKASATLSSFLEHLADSIRTAQPDILADPALQIHKKSWDLPTFFQLLEVANGKLKHLRRRLLLAVDEYEGIDHKIGEGVFPLDLLAMFRESIQSHRQLTWVFVGSHEIGELRHAEWPSYFISARTVEVPLFTLAETRLLLTEPFCYSSLLPHDDPRWPHFEPGTWGERGIENIHEEAGGWPHLVQLLAETLVDLLNQAGERTVSPDLFQRGLSKAVVRGDTVLRQLLENESRLPGEWDYIQGFRRSDTQPPPGEDALHRSLRRRLLVAEENGAGVYACL